MGIVRSKYYGIIRGVTVGISFFLQIALMIFLGMYLMRYSIIAYFMLEIVSVITVFALVTIWSAAKAMLALIYGLNAVNDVEEKRNYIVLRAIACFYTVIILAATLVALFVMVFGNVIVDILLRDIPPLHLVVHVIMRFRFLVSWVILTFIFAMIYAYVPSCKLRFRAQLPGAAFAAVLWSIASFAFSVYVDHYNSFGTYGSLTTVVILMFWFYMLMYILMIGAHINRYFGPVYKFFFGRLDKSRERH